MTYCNKGDKYFPYRLVQTILMEVCKRKKEKNQEKMKTFFMTFFLVDDKTI